MNPGEVVLRLHDVDKEYHEPQGILRILKKLRLSGTLHTLELRTRQAIEDQLPISENEEIVVEMLPSTTAPTASNIRDKRGVLEWAFEAKAGEVRDISFAWRVRWPKDKGVVMVPAG